MKIRRLRTMRAPALLAVSALAAGCLVFQQGASAAPPAASATPAPAAAAAGSGGSAAAPTAPSAPKLANPDRVLAKGWQSSADRAVQVGGDDNGLNVLVADAKDGYAWRTAATLVEPGFDSPRWIGSACVTGSGRYAAVVYGPWNFADSSARDRGGFTAIVDLDTGAVRKLNLLSSMAYYSPGCGSADTVAFSAFDDQDSGSTTGLTTVDAATGAVRQHAVLPGQVTSPVPFGGGIAAVSGDRLIEVDARGRTSDLADESSVPFRLSADSTGGLAYEVADGSQVSLKRFAQGRSAVAATAAAGSVRLQGVAGHVYVVGPKASSLRLATGTSGAWRTLDGAVDAGASTLGALLVDQDAATAGTALPASQASQTDVLKNRITLHATVTGTGAKTTFTVDPSAVHPEQGSTPSPALSVSGSATAKASPAVSLAVTPAANTTGSITNANDSSNPAQVTWDPVRGCAVARNDPAIQTYQATAVQVEWASDLAVQGQLTTARTANWRGSGMNTSWTPQGMFPLQHLDGGGTVPVQVLLGVLAQESNTMQASPHAVDAATGNFNQGGFYGNVSDSSVPSGTTWDTVDCGYGAGQVTTGMTIGTTSAVADGNLSSYSIAQMQQAIATDYASNIAATLNMLIDKWNQLYTAGILANGGDPQYIENWYFAAWAYNSGVQPSSAALGNSTGCTPSSGCTDGNGHWGLGWSNNPANPSYPSDRAVFNATVQYDVSHPQYWPYQEKVLGWAAVPLVRLNYASQQWQNAYAAAYWTSSSGLRLPGFESLCTTADNCTPDGTADEAGHANTAGLCTLSNFHCWWHFPLTWVDCSTMCGKATVIYTSANAEPSGTNVYPPDGCTSSGLPGNAVIVDTVVAAGTCTGTRTWTPQGTMSFSFPESVNPACSADCILYQGKIDFHQVGTGFGGHSFFSHEIDIPATSGTAYAANKSMTATWTPPSTVTGWNRIKVHVPGNGDRTRIADYQINLGNGQQRHRVVNQWQAQSTWLDLGSFDLSAGASVSLSNFNTHASAGDGGDVSFDAVAFIPTAKPLVNYVALGDSYAAGDGITPYQYGSSIAYDPSNAGPTDYCNRSASQAYSEELNWTGLSGTIAATSAAGGAANFTFLACSGAQTVDMTSASVDSTNTWNTAWGSSAANSADFGELYQIDSSGYLDPDTSLVTLSIGGNDARFSDILQGCIVTANPCTGSTYHLTLGNGKVDPQPLTTYEPQIITAEETHLESVYQAIHNQAPNARILVLGYPHLFPQNTTSSTCLPLTITSVQLAAAWLNQMSDALASAISTSIKTVASANPGMNISFVDVRPTFTGHEVCGVMPWINGIVKTGSGVSFHPMAAGDAAEAAQLNTLLK